jgi:glutathione S-transferase
MEQGDFKITERRCKICMSSHRDDIDLMLLGETHREDGSQYRYADIVDWAAVRGLQVTEAGLSRHRNNHLQPSVMAALETQRYMEAISKATGRKLSVHSAVANVIATKTLRLLNDMDLETIDAEKVLRVAMRAAEVSLKIEKAERILTEEQVKSVDEKLSKAGLEPETLRQIREELYGLSDG